MEIYFCYRLEKAIRKEFYLNNVLLEGEIKRLQH